MTHLFIDNNEKMLAAIDYAINTYGDQKWFPAALKITTTEHLLKGDDTTEPLEIFKLQTGGYGYKGYHYIIDKIEKYHLSAINSYSYKYLSLFLFCIIIILIILMILDFKK